MTHKIRTPWQPERVREVDAVEFAALSRQGAVLEDLTATPEPQRRPRPTRGRNNPAPVENTEEPAVAPGEED